MTPLIRTFSLRTLLASVVGFAGLSLVGAAAFRGQLWAQCVLLALAGLMAVFLLHVLFFVGVALLGAIREFVRGSRQTARRASPFAESGVLPERQADRPLETLTGD